MTAPSLASGRGGCRVDSDCCDEDWEAEVSEGMVGAIAGMINSREKTTAFYTKNWYVMCIMTLNGYSSDSKIMSDSRLTNLDFTESK